ncbi:MAG: phosphatase PAP2 family protein [Acidimicrobiia bacterium]
MEARPGLLTRFWTARYGGVLLREFLLLAVMLWLYRYVRFVVKDNTRGAFDNAREVMSFERTLGLDFEEGIQRAFLGHETLVRGINRYYMSVHFAGTVAFLIWAFVRSSAGYRNVRRILVLVTLGALVIHVAYPLAPPRMMPGFVDTMAVFGPNPYHSDAVKSFANQYAAMPSLHVGWALIVTYGVICISRSRLRWFVLAHPVVMTLVVILTANHYWMDGAVAAVLVGGAILLLGRLRAAPEEQSREPPLPVERTLAGIGTG